MEINWRVLIISLIVVYLVGFTGSLFTSGSVNSEWYESIKPSITPPSFVFPIVWNILFFMIGLSLYFVWINSNKKEKKKILLVFGINFILNILWSVFYFGMQNPLLAFYSIILLIFSIASMIYVTNKINKLSSYFLVPYFLWVVFASVLNWMSFH